MRNEFIYDLMKSEEIREYYRKNVELTTEEQASVIIKSYNSIKRKLELLKFLYENSEDEDRSDLAEIIKLYQLVNTIYYKPYEFFGNECRIVYVLQHLKPKCNLLGIESVVNHRLFDTYTGSTMYFNTLEEVIDEMREFSTQNDPFEVDIIVTYNNGNPSIFPIDFYCENIDGIIEPIEFYSDISIFNKYDISNAVYRVDYNFRLKGLPFKNGDRIKIQTPIMDEPFYGILRSEQDYPIDPNSCWYNFVYKDGTNPEEFDNSKILLDVSYTSIDISSQYSVFDWLERA